MQVTVGEKALILDLPEEEVFSLMRGELAGDRVNPYGIGSKINIHPRSKDFEAGLRDVHTCEVSGDNDIDIYLDERRLSDVRLAGLHFPRENIIGRAGDGHLEHFRFLLPPEGIVINFGGSLAVLEVCKFFIED